MNHASRATGSLFAKEFRRLLFSPIAPFAALFFILGSGISFFIAGASLSGTSTAFRQYAERLPYVAAIAIPALAMGAWADERKRGTDLFLFSLPVGDSILIAGKFLAILAIYAIMLSLTAPVVALAPTSGTAAQYLNAGLGSVAAAYLLLFLYGALVAAIGLFFSSLIGNAPASFLASAACTLAFASAHVIPRSFSLPPFVAIALTRLSFAWRLRAASQGVIDSRDIAFYVLSCAFFLILARDCLRRKRNRA